MANLVIFLINSWQAGAVKTGSNHIGGPSRGRHLIERIRSQRGVGAPPGPSVKDVNSLADIGAGNADIGEHVVIKPVEHSGRGVAALPLADRLKDVFHGHGFLVLRAARALKSGMARPRRSGVGVSVALQHM